MLGNNTSKVDYTNKRRLVKIHKLKQENRMLASERKKLINNEIAQRCEYHYPSAYNTYMYARHLAIYRDWETDRKSTRLNSSHSAKSRMPSSA